MASAPLTPRLAQILQEVVPERAIPHVVQRLTEIDFVSTRAANSYDNAMELVTVLKVGSSTWSRLIYELSESECSRSVRRRIEAATTLRPKAPMPKALPRNAVVTTQLRRPTPLAVVQETLAESAALPVDGLSIQHDAAVAALLEVYLEVLPYTSRGATFQAWPEDMKSTYIQWFKSEWGSFSVRALRHAIETLKRFRNWCATNDIRFHMASGPTILLFLLEMKKDGRSLTTLSRSLQIIKDNFGFSWPLDDFEVKRVVTSSADKDVKEVKQAVPFQYAHWYHWNVLLASSSDLVKWIAVINILIIQGVLRFVHIQRSILTNVDSTGIYGLASLGKSARGRSGSEGRRPFRWCAPKVTPWNTDYSVILDGLLNKYNITAAGFLLPSFGPRGSRIEQLTTVESFPMTLSRFHQLSRSLLMTEPLSLSSTDAAVFSSYSGRRLLPTVADLARLDDADRLRVGGWLSEEVREKSKMVKMPNVYAAQKLVTQVRVKAELVSAVAVLDLTHAMAHDWTDIDIARALVEVRESGSPLDPSTEDKLKLASTTQLVSSASSSSSSAANASLSSLTLPLLSQTSSGEPRGSSDPSEDDDDDDNSSLFSDVSAGSDGPVQSVVDGRLATTSETVSWYKPKRGKIHLAKIDIDKVAILSSSICCTFCNKTLRAPDAGVGLIEAGSTEGEWSPRCFDMLPADLQDEVRALFPLSVPKLDNIVV